MGMKRLLFLVLSLPMSLLAEGGLPNQPYIYVEGKAEVEKPADMVTLRFVLVGRDPDQTTANQDVQAKARKVLALLKEHKIAETDVIAGDLASEPEYEETDSSSRKRGKLIGYSVTRVFAVTVREVTGFPKIVDEVIALGGAQFSGIDSRLSNEKEMEGQMWDKALANAKEQADKTLKAAGMKIDSVFAISPVAFPEIHQRIFARGDTTYGVRSAGLEEPSQPEYRLAPISVTQSIHVIFLISPAK
jgi:uncharacterized protein YggE